jgi:integrase
MPSRRQFGTIRRLPSGAWQVRYLDRAGHRHSASFDTKQEAFRHLSVVQADLDRGHWHDPRLATIPFRRWVEQWQLTTVDLRPSTRARDESYLRTMVLPRFGDVPLGEIDHVEVRAWVAELVASGRAPATVVKAAQTMSKIMRGAVDAGRIPSSPCERLSLPRIERSEMRFLTPPEVAALAEAIDPAYRALVLLGAYGGLRAGELFGLRTGRVDTMRGRVDVAEILVEVRGQLMFGPPKTRAGRRSVPLPRFVVDELADHIGARRHAADDLVFASPHGEPVRRTNWRRRYWLPAVERAGVHPLRAHDLRHTAVSLWIAAGASPTEIAARAGHTSVVTVLDRYGHLLPGCEQRVNEALDAMGRNVVPPSPAPVVPLSPRPLG